MAARILPLLWNDPISTRYFISYGTPGKETKQYFLFIHTGAVPRHYEAHFEGTRA
jgi:hypothetical protein